MRYRPTYSGIDQLISRVSCLMSQKYPLQGSIYRPHYHKISYAPRASSNCSGRILPAVTDEAGRELFFFFGDFLGNSIIQSFFQLFKFNLISICLLHVHINLGKKISSGFTSSNEDSRISVCALDFPRGCSTVTSVS